jgi:hypothetical protein
MVTRYLEIDSGSALVTLFIPPLSDEEGGRAISYFLGDDLADYIENATKIAIKDSEENR